MTIPAYALNLHDYNNACDLDPVGHIKSAIAPYEVGTMFAADGAPLVLLAYCDNRDISTLRAYLRQISPMPFRFYRFVNGDYRLMPRINKEGDMRQDEIEAALRKMAAEGVECASDLLILATILDGLRDQAWDFALSAVLDHKIGLAPEPYVTVLKEIVAQTLTAIAEPEQQKEAA